MKNIFALLSVKLRCLFVPDKMKRRKIKDAYKDARNAANYERQKWGVAYSVFDGEELLEASISSIRSQVDYVCVVWQRVSWYGAPANERLYPLLLRLKNEGLIDELIEYEVKLKWKAGKNETCKRNKGLKAARRAGCTYFMSMDTDEFYREKDLIKAKKFIIAHNITHSYCAVNAYGMKPTEFVGEGGCCVQFFTRLTAFSRHCNEHRATAFVDPTRKISHIPWWLGGSKHFFVNGVKMNHYTFIRRDLKKKLQNSSNDDVRKTTIDEVKGGDFLECPDYFNLNELLQKF